MRGREKHIIIIIVSLLLGLIFLYSGYFPWSESVRVYRDFSRGSAHYEICLLLLTGIIVYASIMFRVRIGIVLAVLVTVALVPHQVFKLHEIPFFRPVSFGAAATLTAALVGTILNRRDQLKEARDIQRSLTRQVVTAREKEKQSLAHELHDVILQRAVDVVHEIDELTEEVPEEARKTGLKQLRRDIENIMEQTRQLVQELRPPMLDEIGFVTSLKGLVDSKTEQNIEITLSIRGKERRLPEPIETTLYRIAEEALNNAKRHSQANQIKMVAEFAPEKVSLQISDNGIGFALPTPLELVSQRKFGIVDMSERAQAMGGSFRIESEAGEGMIITVTVSA